MKRIIRAGAMLTVIAGLSACAAAEQALELYDRATEFNRIEDLNDSLGASSAAQVAALSGTAIYTGQTGFGGTIDDTNNVVISAPMTLTANFDALTVNGEITDMMVSELTDKEIADLKAGKARISTILRSGKEGTGTIELAGRIGGETITAAISGSVTANGNTFTVSGDVAGTFRGARAQGVALDETDSFEVTRNGTALDRSIFQAELEAE
ncbi:MAG: hypothetical protein VX874_19960 [Pseudomonadota bacterium]|nr:hypothetical protein [Pseudomonadota bacterium]